MVTAKGRILTGMKEIAQFMGRSEATIKDLQLREGFPMNKVGGIWLSHTEEIDLWARRRSVGGNGARAVAVDAELIAACIRDEVAMFRRGKSIDSLTRRIVGLVGRTQ